MTIDSAIGDFTRAGGVNGEELEGFYFDIAGAIAFVSTALKDLREYIF